MREFASHSIQQLEDLFEASKGKPAILQSLSQELGHRASGRSRKLATQILAALAGQHVKSARKPKPDEVQSPTRPTPSSFPPTGEQIDCVEKFGTGADLKINAFAGTGKTSTLELVARSTSRRGTYLAFNKSIAMEARSKFPKSVSCSTIHGLAFKSVAGSYGSTKMTQKFNANQLAEALNLRDVQIPGLMTLRKRTLASMVLRTIRSYALSGRESLDPVAVPRDGKFVGFSDDLWALIAKCVHAYADRVWRRMCDPVDPIPLGHDGYLKLWALKRPVIFGDFILLDEAQDTNEVVLDVLKAQSAQMIYVGDRFQQIYEWRGAVNAMEKASAVHEGFLTTSFRFGSQIAEAASVVLQLLGENRPMKGNPQIESRIGPVVPEAILGRSNSAVIGAVLDALNSDKRPHVIGGTEELKHLIRAVMDLKADIPSDHPEFFGFTNWREVLEFVESGEGDHLITLINILSNFSEKQLMWALNRCVEKPENADVVISTAHKAKGLEWNSVRLAPGFLNSKQRKQVEASELRLFYVAMTRGRIGLDVPPETLIGLKTLERPIGLDGLD